jgi:hypothetical protein
MCVRACSRVLACVCTYLAPNWRATDGESVRSDWWLYLLGTAAGALGGSGWPGAAMPSLPTNATTTAVGFAYEGLLGRTPDPYFLVDDASGLAAAPALPAAVTALAAQIVGSAEFIHDGLPPPTLATQMFVGILSRQPDPAGLQATIAAIEAGQTAQRASDMIMCQLTHPPC